MDISKLPPPSTANSGVANAQIDLLNRLQQLGSIPARVLSIANGQAILSTQLGDITGNDALKLKAGDTIQIRLVGDKQNPVLKVTHTQDQVTLLPANKYLKLVSLLQPNRPTPAIVIKQQGNNTVLQLGVSQTPVPLKSQFKAGQLLNVTNRLDSGMIEIKSVNHQQTLKSALTQLIPNLPRSSTDSQLLPLLQLLKHVPKIDSGGVSSSQPTYSPTIQNLTGVGTAINTLPKAMQALISGLELLTHSLPTISSLDQRTIQKWIEYATSGTPGDKSTKDSPTTNPFSVLRQLPQTEQGLAQLFQLLMKPDMAQNTKVKQLRETAFDGNAPAMLQFRDAVKSSELSLNQQLFQQTSLRLQQEFQQPIAFSLNIPYIEHQSAKSLHIKIRQKSKQASPENQAWEIRLSFEFGLLGLISAHVLLDGNTLSTNFWAVEESTKIKIDNALPEFKHQLVSSGFNLGHFFCYAGKPSNEDNNDFSPMPDSLLDIKV